MSQPKKPEKKSQKTSLWGSLKDVFRRSVAKVGRAGAYTIGGLGVALLGTTCLSTGLLPEMAASGIAAVGALTALVGSSDIVVDNATKLGRKLGLSTMLVGVAAGAITSFPELFVSTISSAKGAVEVAVGNIVGSNIANIMLILGATAAYKGISTANLRWKFNAKTMALTTVGFGGALACGLFNPLVGAGLLGGLGAYMYMSYRNEKGAAPEGAGADEAAPVKGSAWKMAGIGAAGVGALLMAANMLVDNASAMALSAGISPAFVALAGVAVGTSLPELAVSLKAAKQGNPGLAVGNVFGSNIFNMLLVGGMASMFASGVPAEFSTSNSMGLFNLAALGGSAALGIAALKSDRQFSRREGMGVLALYAAYLAGCYMLSGAPSGDAATAVPQLLDTAAQAAPALPAIMPG